VTAKDHSYISNTVGGLVSTIIPVYNRPALLREAVGSVLAQTYRPIEIIIVNDGSTDETVSVAEDLKRENPLEVRVVHQPNFGPGAAREVGRLQAKGEFVQYLDSDDLLLPCKFELQIAGLLVCPECTLSYGKTREYMIGESPSDVATRRTGERHETIFPAALKGRLWATETPLFRRAALRGIGPWSSLKVLEDWEYECRLGAGGSMLHYCDEFVSDHRHHAGMREGLRWQEDLKVFEDMLTAHIMVLKYARDAGVADTSPEMKHYARNLFRLARDTGVRRLRVHASHLLKLANDIDHGVEYRAYRWISIILGWKLVAICSQRLVE